MARGELRIALIFAVSLFLVIECVSILWMYSEYGYFNRSREQLSLSFDTYPEISARAIVVNSLDGTVTIPVRRSVGSGDVLGFWIILQDSRGSMKSAEFLGPLYALKPLESIQVTVNYRALGLEDVESVSVSFIFQTEQGIVIGNQTVSQPGGGGGGTHLTTIASGSSECNDGVDNDNDGFIDYPLDPGCLSSNGVRESAEESHRILTYAYAWLPLVDESLDNIVPVARVGLNDNGFYPYKLIFNTSNMGSHRWQGNMLGKESSLGNVSFLKEMTDAMPQGHRAFFFFGMASKFRAHPDDAIIWNIKPWGLNYTIWLDNGTKYTATLFDSFFGDYSRIGGKLDVVVSDDEGGINNWAVENIANASYTEMTRIYTSIENDPRFATDIVPRLGFSDLSTVQYRNNGNYLKYNEVMMDRYAEYYNNATYFPIKKYFPNVKMSEWEMKHWDFDYNVPDPNGHKYMFEGDGAVVGTDQAPVCYGYSTWNYGGTSWSPYDGKPYNRTAFNAFRLDVNVIRSAALSSPIPISPWIPYSEWGSSQKDPWGGQSLLNNTDLFQESLLHFMLIGVDYFNYWNVGLEVDPAERANMSDAHVSNCMREFDALAGFDDRRTLVRNLSWWEDDYVLTGMNARGRNVWRFTPDLAVGQNLNETLVNSTNGEIVFKTKQARISIPDGILYDPGNALCSRRGYWVIQPDSAQKPVIESLS